MVFCVQFLRFFVEIIAKFFTIFSAPAATCSIFGKFARRILQRKVEILLPQHARDLIKTLISRRKATDPNFSVQKMCDDKGLPKSTIDKFLAGQTNDTSWFNVVAMVSYLGGSLDELAGIQREAAMDEAAQQLQQASPSKPSDPDKSIRAEYPALALLVESYEKEIRRNADHHQAELDRTVAQHVDYLERFRRLNKESADSLVAQHTAAYTSLARACQEALEQQKDHLNSALRGRNVWRYVAIGLIIAFGLSVIGLSVYAVWEFSDPYTGFTASMLRRYGILPTPVP